MSTLSDSRLGESITVSNEYIKVIPRLSITYLSIDNYTATNFHQLFIPMTTGFCMYLKNLKDTVLPDDEQQEFVVSIKVNCRDVFYENQQGTGNWILFYYAMRKVAIANGNTTVIFKCTELLGGSQSPKQFLLPWLSGTFPASYKHLYASIREEVICEGSYNQWDIRVMIPILQYDLQRMAIGLLGAYQDGRHPSAEFAESFLKFQEYNLNSKAKYSVPVDVHRPILSNVSLDDVVIHFRCGDLMYISHPWYGMYKFDYFTRYISVEAKTLGIITQPFHDNATQTRQYDWVQGSGSDCEIIVEMLANYVKLRFPGITRVTIHNGPDETVAISLSRMILANQTIACASSFSILSSLATFGTAYIPFNNNGWLETIFHDQNSSLEVNRHIKFVDPGPFIPSTLFQKLWSDNNSFVRLWFSDVNKSL